MKFICLLVTMSFFFCLLVPLEGAKGKLKGFMAGDYHYEASGDEKGRNGFKFRRIYLTYNFQWNDQFSGRLRYEAKDKGFGKKDKMDPFVKHAYLRYRKNGRAVIFGLSGTPTWNISERIWGYQSIYKTIMDLHKIGSSADLGIAYQGKLDNTGKVSVKMMLGNGSGQSPEVDNQKKLYLLFHLKLLEMFELTGYFDFEGKPDDRNRVTYAGFIGRSGKEFHGGVEGFVRINKNEGIRNNLQVRGISVFGAQKISSRTKFFGRFDFYDPNSQANEDQEFLVIGGADFMPIRDVHVVPNIVSTSYQAFGTDSKMVLRMTLYFKF